MAWSGISDVPAARAAVAVSDLAEAHDGAERLRAFLLHLDGPHAAWAQQVIDGVLTKLSSARSALDVSDAGGSDGARPQQSGSSCGGNKKKQSSSRRSQRASDKKLTATLEDGHVWRKYGQKDIQDSPYPRSYYRCTHKSDQGCGAKRQVQICETDTSRYVVTYYGEHTCRDPSTIPLADHAGAALAGELDDHAVSNLMISFGPSGSGATTNAANAAAAAASNSGGGGGGASASSSQYHYHLQAMGGSGDQLSTSWCTSDDVFSSSAGSLSLMQVDNELIGAVVVGSAGGVTSVASDHRGVLGGGVASGGSGRGTASFPPSPNSLGFVVGSLGSIGGGGGEDDDDMFRLDDP